jgi:DNA-binding transcriptional ArsR family regulator
MAQIRIDIFDALADPTRRRILEILAARTLAAGEIARRFPQCRPAISKHLTILKRAGLLREQRQAQRRLYSVRPDALVPVATFLEGILPPAPSEASPPHEGNAPIEAVAQPPTASRSAGFELEFD